MKEGEELRRNDQVRPAEGTIAYLHPPTGRCFTTTCRCPSSGTAENTFDNLSTGDNESSAKWQMKFRVFAGFQWFLGFGHPGNAKPGYLCRLSEMATALYFPNIGWMSFMYRSMRREIMFNDTKTCSRQTVFHTIANEYLDFIRRNTTRHQHANP